MSIGLRGTDKGHAKTQIRILIRCRPVNLTASGARQMTDSVNQPVMEIVVEENIDSGMVMITLKIEKAANLGRKTVDLGKEVVMADETNGQGLDCGDSLFIMNKFSHVYSGL
jgi:ABC-type uncharacterized transport system ATPase component